MNWCISLRPKYANAILEGRKTIEIRTRLPKCLSREELIFVCVSGSNGMIPFSFRVRRKVLTETYFAWKRYNDLMCISMDDYEKYTTGHDLIWLIEIKDLQVYNPPRNISEFNMKRPPMWFTRILTEVTL